MKVSMLTMKFLLSVFVMLNIRPAFAQENINKKLYFAYEATTAPISSYYGEGQSGSLHGYCSHLKERLALKRRYDIVDFHNLDRDLRFKENQNDNIFRVDAISEIYGEDERDFAVVLCGPITVTEDRKKLVENENGKFSDIYYVSRGKLLVLKEIYKNISYKDGFFKWKSDSIWNNSDFMLKRQADIKIGLLGKTTSSFVYNYFSLPFAVIGHIWARFWVFWHDIPLKYRHSLLR